MGAGHLMNHNNKSDLSQKKGTAKTNLLKKKKKRQAVSLVSSALRGCAPQKKCLGCDDHAKRITKCRRPKFIKRNY